MPWSTFSGAKSAVSGAVASLDFAGDAAAMVRERVRQLRGEGHKNADAIALTAEQLGLSERRVRGLLYGEVWCVVSDEYERIRAGWARSLDAEAERLEREAVALRRRASAALREQGRA